MYLPKSKYVGDLYSNGTLYQGNTPYFGYYFKTRNALYFTGKYPGDGPNFPLTDVGSLTEEVYNVEYSPSEYYIVNNDINYQNTATFISTPQQAFRSPTESDYKVGEYIRYFAKKTNENIYYETQTQFASNSLYIGFTVPWLLTGDKETVYNINKRMVLLKEQQLQISGLGFFLKDNYLKFYK